jgi:hypothetical protein
METKAQIDRRGTFILLLSFHEVKQKGEMGNQINLAANGL